MDNLDFTTWTWTYTNDTDHPVRIDSNTVLQPGESKTFRGVASTSQQGAEDFLDSYNSLLNNPNAQVTQTRSINEALRQATVQAPNYITGVKKLNIAHDTKTNLDPATKDGNISHIEDASDLYDFETSISEDEAVVTAIKKTPDIDPSTPPPQAPPTGEAEKRSKDEEKQTPKVADPVNPFTGEFYLEKIDFELPSIGFPFTFVRTYKSGRTFFGPFGYNWDHNYNVYLRELNNGSIAVSTGSLQEDIYSDSGDSLLYNPPRGVFAKLERQQGLIPAFDYILTFKGGIKWYFKDSGFERIPLVKIEDTNNNYQQLIYNNKNQLVTVVDTVGRRINFIYGNCDLLEELQPEFLQPEFSQLELLQEPRKPPVAIKYMHAHNIEQLCAVITFPTPDFPNGLMTCYEYDDYQPLPELRNNILRVIDAKGQTIVENLYGIDTTDDSFNRVVKQYFMGGEYLFKYTNIRYIPPFDEYVNDAYLQTEFYEPNRPLKVLTYNFRGNLLDERFRLCADGSYRVWAQSYRYNQNGQLTKMYYANGMADFYKYYEYDPNIPLSDISQAGNLLQIDRQSQPSTLISRTISKFTYEPLYQKIKTVEDENHNITEFVYEHEVNPLATSGNLVKIKYPDSTLPDGTLQNNCEAKFKYDNKGQLIEELTPERRKKTYKYYLHGKGAGLVKKITAHDNVSPLINSFEYDALGNIKRIIDGLGNDTLFEHNLIGQLVKTELPSINGKRATYKFEYNEDRKITREYLPKGSYSDSVLNDGFIINEYLYDVASWLVEVRKYINTEFPQVTKIQRDFFGNPIMIVNSIGQEFRYKYDDRSLILEEIKFSSAEYPLKTKYHYDRMGNLDKVTYPDGPVEIYYYDDSFTRLKSKTNHVGVTEEYFYDEVDPLTGNIIRRGVRDEVIQKIIKDATGTMVQTQNFTYDERGRLIKSDINGLTSQVFYDKDDLTIKTINHQNNATTIDYDRIGRTIGITDPLGNQQTTSFDANGNLNSTRTQTILNGNNISIKQQVVYDKRNRPIATTDPLGNTVSFIYDDRNLKTGVINALGQQVNLYYDINGETIKSCLVRSAVEHQINQWNRDLIGRLISYQDAENNITRYLYDERGSLIKTEYPDGSTITKEYNSNGYLKAEKDCNGTISDFTYNNAGQLTQIDFQVNGGALLTPSISYGYDALGRNNVLLRGTHRITRKFDAFNRIIEEKQGTETVKRAFDDVNNHVALTFPDGRIDKYKMDKLGRVKEVIFEKKGTANCLISDFAEGSILSQLSYEGLFLKSKKYANNTVTEYIYDIEGRLAAFDVKDRTGNIIDGEQYLYDREKRKRIILRKSLPQTNKFFNYDELSRLTESYTGVNAAVSNNLNNHAAIDNFLSSININAAVHKEKYTLTDNDKRTIWEIDGVQYSANYNNLLQLTSVIGGANINYTYDKNGNRTSDDLFNYFYDALDNLVKVVSRTDNTVVLEHVYDATGRIIERKEGRKLKLFFYDGTRSIHEKQNASIVQNAFGIGLDEYIVQSKGVTNFFYHQNSTLSLNSTTGNSGNILQYYDFKSFGIPTVFDSGKNLIALSNSQVDILFSGRPFLNVIEKYDFRKRVYDCEVGLFMQRDIFEYYNSSNNSLFCKHNPVSNTDSNGMVIPLVVGLLAVASSGAMVGGGFSLIRQSIQIAEGYKDENGNIKSGIDWVEVQDGALYGSVLAPIAVLLPEILVPLALIGVVNGDAEIRKGNSVTGWFDIASSILPLKSLKSGFNKLPRSSRLPMIGLQTVEAANTMVLRVGLNEWAANVKSGNVRDAKAIGKVYDGKIDQFRTGLIENRVGQQLLSEGASKSMMSFNKPMFGLKEIGEIDVEYNNTIHEVKTGKNFMSTIVEQLQRIKFHFPDKKRVAWLDPVEPTYVPNRRTGEKSFTNQYKDTLKNIAGLDAEIRFLNTPFLQGANPKVMPEGIPLVAISPVNSPSQKN